MYRSFEQIVLEGDASVPGDWDTRGRGRSAHTRAHSLQLVGSQLGLNCRPTNTQSQRRAGCCSEGRQTKQRGRTQVFQQRPFLAQGLPASLWQNLGLDLGVAAAGAAGLMQASGERM